ncbi:MAG TPA: TldD/PmbA family protein [Candidatus Solibacter sp.]|nr:TldD/PmbA family protein [Candidatus Solibacter sp.]
MISERRDLRDLTDEILSASDAEQTEVIVTESDTALTRFANSEIHQNVAERNIDVRIRVINQQRTGVASTNQMGADALREALARALESARTQPARPDLPPLAPPAKLDPIVVDDATAHATPEERAQRVGAICAQADAAGVRAFGALSTGSVNYAVANSNGLFISSPRAVAHLRTVAMADDGSGYADRTSSHLADIDAEAAGAEAIDKCMRTRGAEPIEPGVYPVILEEYAVAELIEYLSFIGFSGLAVEEGRSFMRPGEKITGEAISIWDDGADLTGLPMPLDWEGVPRRRVEIIAGGAATGLVHDMASAARAGVESTGHGLPAPNPTGALAVNLFMAGGSAKSKDELCEGIERGVWVSRFWYVNIVHPKQSQLTGMTRDGTFLIENGKVTRAIKNMRFTQSVMEAFGTASALTSETKLQAGDDYDFTAGIRVPAVRLDRFNFTSVTR